MSAGRPSPVPLLAGLVILLAAFAGTSLRTLPPSPRSAAAPAGEFSAERARVVLDDLVGDGLPHPVGSDENARIRERVVQRFEALGYRTEVQAAFACTAGEACGDVRNVIATREGRRPRPAVLVATHYDSVAAGPGASDAGASVAAILEMARALATEPAHRHPIVFLVDDGEEAGLLGASAFVRDHPLAPHIGVVVNLEARGTSGPSWMFETSGDNGWIIDRLAGSAPRPLASSLFYPVYRRLPNDTDLTVFKRAGMPGLNFAFIGDVAQYHTPLDSYANASPASLQHQGENALAVVRALADADLERPPDGNVVFFDVLGFAIARWPVELSLPLAGIALALVCLAAAGFWWRGHASIWRSVLAFVAWAVMLAAAGGAAWGLGRGLTSLGAWPGDRTTAPTLAVLAFWLLGLGVVSLLAAVVGRWTRPGGAWTGTWLGWAIAGIPAAAWFPEASYLLIVPALAAGTIGVLGLGWRTASLFEPAAFPSALPLAAAAVLIMPPAWSLFDALGPTALPVIAAVIALLSTSLSAVTAAAGRVRWVVPATAFAAVAGLSAASLTVPAYSAEHPERMNITFVQQAGDDEARWVVSPQSGTLPGPLRERAPFGLDRERAYPWSSAPAFVAKADRIPADAPRVDVLDRAGGGDDLREIRLRVSSLRGAPVLTLLLPADRVVSARIDGLALPSSAPVDADRQPNRGAGTRLRAFMTHAVPADGVEIALTVAGDAPLDGWVLDRSYGLPPAGDALIQARPPTAAPFATGDVTIVAGRVRF